MNLLTTFLIPFQGNSGTYNHLLDQNGTWIIFKDLSQKYWTSSRYPWWDIETLVLGYGGASLYKKILPDTEFYSNTFINHAYEPFFCILLISTRSADTYFPRPAISWHLSYVSHEQRLWMHSEIWP